MVEAGLYVTVPVYMVFIIATGVYTYLRRGNQQAAAAHGADAAGGGASNCISRRTVEARCAVPLDRL